MVERDGMLIMVDDDRLPMDERREARDARGALPHARLLSTDRRHRVECDDGARDHRELLAARSSERQGRVIDHDQAGSMEKKKQEGYF